MAKVQKISAIIPTLGFTEFDIYQQYKQSFHTSELGLLSRSFPIAEIAASLGLRDSDKGRRSYFSPYAKVALMILKNYTRLSDRELIANLNSNIHYQLFCGISIHPLSPLTNYKILSEIRCQIGDSLDIPNLEKILASHWKPYLSDTQIMMTDATCYTTSLRYPTDPKLLWECVYWIYHQLKRVVKSLGFRMPRNKYLKQAKRYSSYSRKRKRSKTQTRVLKRSLLHLLDKLLIILQGHVDSYISDLNLTKRFAKRLSTITKILSQQQALFRGEIVKDRIVSIDKDYIHPIVRGKEKVAVEYGAKVNSIQIGGINFIERFSWSAFNECKELKNSVLYAQQLFHRKVKMLAADAIYATNENRSYCRAQGITTSFVRKGKAGVDEPLKSIARSVLSKERATRLEGSFGIEKQKYHLDRIKARTDKTEIVWIFFGIHTANAVRMIPKIFSEGIAEKITA